MIEALLFPRLVQPVPASEAAGLGSEGEAGCFNHPDKRAEGVCDLCGRFICSLCEIDIEGRKACPNCLEGGRKKHKFKDLERERTRWDVLAFNLALLGLLIFYLSMLIAPVTLYVSLRHWNTPLSVLSASRWRFVAAIALATLQLAGWGVALAVMLGA